MWTAIFIDLQLPCLKCLFIYLFIYYSLEIKNGTSFKITSFFRDSWLRNGFLFDNYNFISLSKPCQCLNTFTRATTLSKSCTKSSQRLFAFCLCVCGRYEFSCLASVYMIALSRIWKPRKVVSHIHNKSVETSLHSWWNSRTVHLMRHELMGDW